MRSVLIAALLLSTGAACSKKSQDGLPPASAWQTNNSGTLVPPPAPATPPGMGNPSAGDPDDPHAGMAMAPTGEDPHAGLGAGMDPSNPHAGLGMDPNDPHGGGADVSKLGLPAPDPNRAIDPNHFVRGVIKIDAKAKDHVKPGGVVFLAVRRADPAGGTVGPPLATEKLSWSGDHISFELTEAQAMVAGTQLVGDVVVTAHYDQDSDAISKQPGDVIGQAHVKLPAGNVQIMLDTIL